MALLSQRKRTRDRRDGPFRRSRGQTRDIVEHPSPSAAPGPVHHAWSPPPLQPASPAAQDRHRELQDALSRLQAESQSLQQKNEAWRRQFEARLERERKLEEELQAVRRKLYDLERWKEYAEKLRVREEAVTRELQRLQDALAEQKSAAQKDRLLAEQLEQRCAALLANLAEARRDRSATYSSGPRPQLHQISERYIQLRDGDLQRVVNHLYRLRSQTQGRVDRASFVARTRSELTEEILILAPRRLERQEGSGAMRAETLVHVGQELINRISADIPGAESERKALTEGLLRLVAGGLQLVQDCQEAEDSARFFLVESGTPYQEADHTLTNGCDGTGPVLLTVYPGLGTSRRVLLKPVVFTQDRNYSMFNR